MNVKFHIHSWVHEVEMVPGFGYEPSGPQLYIPEIVLFGKLPDGNEWAEFAGVPGADPQIDRRKAKRLLNRYRKFRNNYTRKTGQSAPYHYY